MKLPVTTDCWGSKAGVEANLSGRGQEPPKVPESGHSKFHQGDVANAHIEYFAPRGEVARAAAKALH
jgi:hypothetical protein